MTLAPASVASLMPTAMASASAVWFWILGGSSSTRTGKIVASGARPANGTCGSGSGRAAISAAMNVPLPKQSPSPVFTALPGSRLMPGNTAPRRVGALPLTPVSTTPTTIPRPLVKCHTRSGAIRCCAHDFCLIGITDGGVH